MMGDNACIRIFETASDNVVPTGQSLKHAKVIDSITTQKITNLGEDMDTFSANNEEADSPIVIGVGGLSPTDTKFQLVPTMAFFPQSSNQPLEEDDTGLNASIESANG